MLKIGNIKIKDIEILQNNKNKDELVRLLWRTKVLNAEEINAQLKINAGQGGVGKGNPGGIINGNGAVFKTRTAYKPVFVELISSKNWVADHLKYGKPESDISVRVKKAGVFEKGNGKVIHYAQEKVIKWYYGTQRGGPESKEVCAFKFTDTQEVEYRLKTFATAAGATKAEAITSLIDINVGSVLH